MLMPVYIFRGRNVRTNENISGETIFEQRPGFGRRAAQGADRPRSQFTRKKSSGFNFPSAERVSQSEIAIFTRQFSVMLDAGLPLVQGLDAIAQQHPNEEFKSVLEQIRGDVESRIHSFGRHGAPSQGL